MKRAIVSCAFGKNYPALLKRQINQCRKICPQYNHIYWFGYPPNSKPHSESRYGFKVHAIREAIKQGFDQILWLDSAMYPIAPIERMWEETEKIGVFTGQDSVTIADHAFPPFFDYFKKTWEEVNESKMLLCAGSFYCFDFTNHKAIKVFDELEAAEHAGIFGSEKLRNQLTNNKNFKGTNRPRGGDEPVLAMILKNNQMAAPIKTKCSVFDPDPFLSTGSRVEYIGKYCKQSNY